ncbi:hypothetical protein GCM10025875_18160 [Litorihabitans aurantiacus]|uniref:Signal recognition particle protein n=1 Tax=Litorihabitans aurantiacus TaxID=1930061 RepID=A0AA38CST9_9MICO|nr:hypothetical protein GCM10025875_18160 [Litorihabitans aurantiacus]
MTEVNGLLDRFDQAKTMMRSMAKGGGMPGMPGMGGGPGGFGMGSLPGGGKKSKGRMAAPVQRGKKSKSGNPAKRAAAARAAEEKSAAAPSGSAFGLGAPQENPGKLEIPEGLGKLFGR